MVSYLDLLPAAADRLQPPVAVVMPGPLLAAALVQQLGREAVVCYHMDLFHANRLRAELGADARLETGPDLWDLPADFQTVVYPVPEGGDRELKLDLIEQAYHILRQRGRLVVLSPYDADSFFPAALKKVFGPVHFPQTEAGTVLWCRRDVDRPRRRHEVTFQARVGGGPSLRFLSRPGTFSYGRLDSGSRALIECMTVRPGDRVLDLGCGCGTNGVYAAQASGPTGHTTFVDSNFRAVALAEHNARANGLTAFQTVASSAAEGLAEASFDVALANPPYYAQGSIARRFIDRCRALLRPAGRLYLVTKQVRVVAPLLVEAFGDVEAVECRGYTVLSGRRSRGPA